MSRVNGALSIDQAAAKAALINKLVTVRQRIKVRETELDLFHNQRAAIFHELHLLGVSWAEIGRLDGITDQAASKHARKRHPRETAS